MLVLTRKINQSIQIGENVELTILAIDGDQIKIGINAPKHIEIHRKEVYLAIQEENTLASAVSIELLKGLSKQVQK
ncbi:MAG TPA: carbon storage regulator CsrA [Bacillus bacterium]|nr:carbon storage regulator CsrA [Bacillus sp. (in: firmicutes)]